MLDVGLDQLPHAVTLGPIKDRQAARGRKSPGAGRQIAGGLIGDVLGQVRSDAVQIGMLDAGGSAASERLPGGRDPGLGQVRTDQQMQVRVAVALQLDDRDEHQRLLKLASQVHAHLSPDGLQVGDFLGHVETGRQLARIKRQGDEAVQAVRNGERHDALANFPDFARSAAAALIALATRWLGWVRSCW
jgi:hypothetical protein